MPVRDLLLCACIHVVCPTCGRHASECDKTCGFCDLNLDGDGHRRRRRNQIISGDSAECPFANYQDRVDSVNAACCDEPGICDNGVPVRKRKRNTATRLSRSRNRPSSWDRIVSVSSQLSVVSYVPSLVCASVCVRVHCRPFVMSSARWSSSHSASSVPRLSRSRTPPLH